MSKPDKSKLNISKLVTLIQQMDLTSTQRGQVREVFEELLRGVFEDPNFELRVRPISATDIVPGAKFVATTSGSDPIWVSKEYTNHEYADTRCYFFTGLYGNPHAPYSTAKMTKQDVINYLTTSGYVRATA